MKDFVSCKILLEEVKFLKNNVVEIWCFGWLVLIEKLFKII